MFKFRVVRSGSYNVVVWPVTAAGVDKANPLYERKAVPAGKVAACRRDIRSRFQNVPHSVLTVRTVKP